MYASPSNDVQENIIWRALTDHNVTVKLVFDIIIGLDWKDDNIILKIYGIGWDHRKLEHSYGWSTMGDL